MDEDFTQKLQCPVCTALSEDLAVLDCGHSVCSSCIAKAQEAGAGCTCPECRAGSTEKSSTLSAEKAQRPLPQPRRRAQHKCPEHNEKLMLFCQDDGTLACLVCRDSAQHSNHSFLPVQEAAELYKDKLKAAISPLELKLKGLSQEKYQQEQGISKVKKESNSLEEQIASEFAALHQFLQEKEQSLQAQLWVEEGSLLQQREKALETIEKEMGATEKKAADLQKKLEQEDPILFLTGMKHFSETCSNEINETIATKDSLVCRELSLGVFKGPLQYAVWKEMKSIISHVPSALTLEPSTAHRSLRLSMDLTSVEDSNDSEKVANNTKRFDFCLSVLSTQGFFSGRHYWEVEVGRKTKWELGVVGESINRKGEILALPENQFWVVCLRKGGEYWACDSPSKRLYPSTKPRKVGIFLDCEEGQVSFYDADGMHHLYTFTAMFTERLFPYFSPCRKDAMNVEPLKLFHLKL
ncbi:zinc-binding protein A33-like [Latimeria chalumnae]|uniref:Tripartite motif containing 69 n=1 Tax=Latimeria chalumnae TaxID=7897 RepID=H3ABE3_LATCH|nr:PREDICTED: zinc-binding protein A33-like [Latimeria chalumnae]|eukprot:XP_006009634.1 PREDICTED: zinc-binding protein A33-like [Latimeria chalumnae]